MLRMEGGAGMTERGASKEVTLEGWRRQKDIRGWTGSIDGKGDGEKKEARGYFREEGEGEDSVPLACGGMARGRGWGGLQALLEDELRFRFGFQLSLVFGRVESRTPDNIEGDLWIRLLLQALLELKIRPNLCSLHDCSMVRACVSVSPCVCAFCLCVGFLGRSVFVCVRVSVCLRVLAFVHGCLCFVLVCWCV
jgi:hypothetical protein